MCVLALAFYSLAPPHLKEAAGGENRLPGQVNHALAYCVTGVALRWAYPRSSPWRTILLLAGYGCVLELLQTFVPGRSPKIIDALSSGLGAAMGVAVGLTLLDLVIRWARQDRVRFRDKGG
jgi:VanZ family protein